MVLGLVGVDVIGLVGWMLPKISRIMFLSRIQAIGQKESQPEEWAKVRQTCVFPGLAQKRMAFKEDGCEKHEWADNEDKQVSVGR